jgi:membrane protease subunit HflK
VSKVLVDSRNNSNLLYLPFDKLMQQAGVPAAAAAAAAPEAPVPTTALPVDARSRDNQRGRDRESR